MIIGVSSRLDRRCRRVSRQCAWPVQGHDGSTHRRNPPYRSADGQRCAPGRDPATWPILRATLGPKDNCQIHYSAQPSTANINSPVDLIINLDQAIDGYAMIKLSVQSEGTYTVTNTRNGFTKMYKPGIAGGKKKS